MLKDNAKIEYVKIINCSSDQYWYLNHIGEVFKVSFIDSETGAVVISNIDGSGNMMGSIFPGDFEECVEYEQSELFQPPEPPKSEEQLKLESLQNELEITQNALNEMLMVMMSEKGGD